MPILRASGSDRHLTAAKLPQRELVNELPRERVAVIHTSKSNVQDQPSADLRQLQSAQQRYAQLQVMNSLTGATNRWPCFTAQSTRCVALALLIRVSQQRGELPRRILRRGRRSVGLGSCRYRDECAVLAWGAQRRCASPSCRRRGIRPPRDVETMRRSHPVETPSHKGGSET